MWVPWHWGTRSRLPCRRWTGTWARWRTGGLPGPGWSCRCLVEVVEVLIVLLSVLVVLYLVSTCSQHSLLKSNHPLVITYVKRPHRPECSKYIYNILNWRESIIYLSMHCMLLIFTFRKKCPCRNPLFDPTHHRVLGKTRRDENTLLSLCQSI